MTDDSDDEYLTAEGPLAQPRDHQVVMAGFHYISKIFMREQIPPDSGGKAYG
jgi:hypothetical protein